MWRCYLLSHVLRCKSINNACLWSACAFFSVGILYKYYRKIFIHNFLVMFQLVQNIFNGPCECIQLPVECIMNLIIQFITVHRMVGYLYLDLITYNLDIWVAGTWRFLDSTNGSSRFPDFRKSTGNSVIELVSTPTKITGVHYVQVSRLICG